MMREKKRIKLRPHYFWLCGLFVIGGLVVSIIWDREPESTHASNKTMANLTYMQEMTAEICKNSGIGETANLIDKRGNTEADYVTYSVRKHGDGNCWMTQNLRLVDYTLTSDDSDLREGTSFTLPKSDISGFQAMSETDGYAAKVYYAGNATNGAYYNWYTATAGAGDSSIFTDGAIANTSICPKGWKLPTGYQYGQFSELSRMIGGAISTWVGFPYNFGYAGYTEKGTYKSTLSGGGNAGIYWSRTTTGNPSYASSLTMNSSNKDVLVNFGWARYSGASVRRVAANALEETWIEAMQDMTVDVCAAGNIGDVMGLEDKRDGKYYRIAKLQNKGNDEARCWMISNLALDLTTNWNTLKMIPALSDVERGWSAPKAGMAIEANSGFAVGEGNYNKVQYTNSRVSGTNWWEYLGYYYSWCAATAGGCEDNSVNQVDTRNASQSICPAGWKLPIGGSGGDFVRLYGSDIDDKGSIAITPFVNTALYSFWDSGYMNSSGRVQSDGYFWSSSLVSSDRSYSLKEVQNISNNIRTLIIYPEQVADRSLGYSIRCINDPGRRGFPGGGIGKDSASADFSVTVNDAITLSSVEFSNSDGTSNTISAMPGQLATGSINVNVGSNVKYKITMNSQSPDLASKTDGNTNVIPAITTTMTADQLKTNYGWGVLKKNADNVTDDTVYTGLNSTDQTFYTSDEPAGASKVTNFGVGVGVPPTIPADTYSTEVTITAIATE